MAAAPFLYSFSGSDAKAFAYFYGRSDQIVRMDSLHTVSFSVHEAKGDARALGFRAIKGLSRGVRTIAGSMIFLVINDHPLRDLINLSYQLPDDQQVGWSIDRYLTGQGTVSDRLAFTNRLPVLLPPFDMHIEYVSELTTVRNMLDENGINQGIAVEGAACMLNGIEFIDSGQVTSIQDTVTEVTYSFKARDYKELCRNDFITSAPPLQLSNREQERLQAILAEELGYVPVARGLVRAGDDADGPMTLTEYEALLAQDAATRARSGAKRR